MPMQGTPKPRPTCMLSRKYGPSGRRGRFPSRAKTARTASTRVRYTRPLEVASQYTSYSGASTMGLATFKPVLALSLSDWASIAGIAGAILAVIGLVFVIIQLRGAAASSRVQATIQFQQAFHQSREARARFLGSFPVHEDALANIHMTGNAAAFPKWRSVDDLTKSQKADAAAVVNALNDVAQYVADGLPLYSALQQYHTIFVRAGLLLNPYLDARNSGTDARWGARTVELFNAALAYHRGHPKHSRKELRLVREDPAGSIVLVGGDGTGLSMHPGFPYPGARRRAPGDGASPRKVVRAAEWNLRH
jgi:hypothetical protein